MIKKVKEMIKIVEADGWRFCEEKGSHMQYIHPTKQRKVTIPNHGLSEDLDHRLVDSI